MKNIITEDEFKKLRKIPDLHDCYAVDAFGVVYKLWHGGRVSKIKSTVGEFGVFYNLNDKRGKRRKVYASKLIEHAYLGEPLTYKVYKKREKREPRLINIFGINFDLDNLDAQ